MSAEPVRKLYITLRRSFAGTRETQRRTLETLGLRYREQTSIQDNSGSVRGAIDKVSIVVFQASLLNREPSLKKCHACTKAQYHVRQCGIAGETPCGGGDRSCICSTEGRRSSCPSFEGACEGGPSSLTSFTLWDCFPRQSL